MEYLKIEQVESILRAAFSSKRDHLLLLLTYTHGLRRGETAAIRLPDLGHSSIKVERLKGSLSTTHPLRESENELFDEKRALDAWLGERKVPLGRINDFLFPSKDGQGHIELSTVSKLASRIMRSAGVPEPLAHTHAMKHAICSQLARSGAKIENIAQYVGHKDIKNTRTYLNITDSEAAAAAFTALDGITRKH